MKAQLPYSRTSTAAEVLDRVDLGRRRAIVTGASSGVGVAITEALTAAGVEVTLAMRDVDAAAPVGRETVRRWGDGPSRAP
jgi:NAD(P)-dependent dehydrogenase (short-subunit alcohol dehydrogenase family)